MTIEPEQLAFEGVGERSAPLPRLVLGFDPAHTTNAQRIVDLASLGYLPSPVLDCTYGMGMFWNRWRPEVLVATDLDPDRAVDLRCDFRALPFADRAFPAVVFDPPYKVRTGGHGSPASMSQGGRDVSDRYGFRGDLRSGTIGKPWVAALPECLRVADKFCVVKCQDQVGAWQSYDVVAVAATFGWRLKDLLLLEHKGLPNPNRQRHARRNLSAFVVLQRVRRRMSS